MHLALHQPNFSQEFWEILLSYQFTTCRCIEGTEILQPQSITVPLVFNGNGGGDLAEYLQDFLLSESLPIRGDTYIYTIKIVAPVGLTN